MTQLDHEVKTGDDGQEYSSTTITGVFQCEGADHVSDYHLIGVTIEEC